MAAQLEIEVLNPTPNAVHIMNTNITFELQIADGDPGIHRVEWDLDWDGTTVAWGPTDTDSLTDILVATFPVRAIGAAAVAGLRVNKVYDSVDRKNYRVRVDNTGDPEIPLIQTGRITVVDEISIGGYTWTGASTSDDSGDPVGWTSFSCANQNLVCAAVPTYAVRFTKAPGGPFGAFQDHAWVGTNDDVAGNTTLGWASFNKGTCSGGANKGKSCLVATDCPDLPGDPGTCDLVGSPPATFDGETWSSFQELNHVYSSYYGPIDGETRYPGQVAGWGRYLTLRDYGATLGDPTWGWMHLRGQDVTPPYTPLSTQGFQQCVDCSANGTKCNICNKVNIGPTVCLGGVSNGNACTNNAACSGGLCTPTCRLGTNAGNACLVDADCPNGTCTSLKDYSCNSCYDCAGGKCNSCESCSLYGVSYNSQLSQFVGYAWADGSDGGQGWVQFDSAFGGIGVLQAWLATRYGDIFVGGGGISVTTPLPAPPGTFNATYLIQSNGTVEFTSEAGYVQPNYPTNIQIPSAEKQYINVLGRIDFQAMTLNNISESPKKHRYGETVWTRQEDVDLWSSKRLEGKVYYVQGDLTIKEDKPILFEPGYFDGTNDISGAGTKIVDGDLIINADITYNTTAPVGKIQFVPSVAWLVRGNVTINPSVGASPAETDPEPSIVGAYIAVGCPGGTALCGGTVKDGVIATGSSTSLELIVGGLMMAKRFQFERSVGSQRGSEQVVYDGRLVGNPPPGLQDLTGILPIIREVTP